MKSDGRRQDQYDVPRRENPDQSFFDGVMLVLGIEAVIIVSLLLFVMYV